ncbi:hypothetical protein Tco_0496544 [Tanacetum coccineum]
MSSGSQSAGEPVLPKFDMHTYTSNLTVDDVNSLVKEYAIPLDLRPRVPPSTLTMNNLPANRIDIYEQYLELSGVRVHFSTLLLVATSMSQFLKFPNAARRSRISIGLPKRNEAIVQNTLLTFAFLGTSISGEV